MRVLRGTSAAAGVAYYTDESLADAGAVTVTVTRGDGRVVVSAAAAVAGTGDNLGRYTYTLSPAVTAEVERFTLTWTSAGLGQRVTEVEVVGGHLVDLAELREDVDLRSSDAHPTSKLVAARDAFTADAEEFCGRAFNPTYAYAAGKVGPSFTLPHDDVRRLLSVSTGAAAASTDVAGWTWTQWGRVTRPGYLYDTTAVAYEHGLTVTPPDVRDVSVLAIRDRLLSRRSGRPNRIFAQTDELGATQRFSTPGATRLTGIIDVDAVFERYRRTGALVG